MVKILIMKVGKMMISMGRILMMIVVIKMNLMMVMILLMMVVMMVIIIIRVVLMGLMMMFMLIRWVKQAMIRVQMVLGLVIVTEKLILVM